VFPVRYELGLYIPEDGILYSHRRVNLKYYKHESYSYGSYKTKEKPRHYVVEFQGLTAVAVKKRRLLGCTAVMLMKVRSLR
jgi:hypothetical protein